MSTNSASRELSEISITVCSLSVYLHTVLKNHTAHACEGDTLIIQCPSRTSVSILSAFYGRRVPNQHLCPFDNSNVTAEEDTECTSSVAIEVYNMRWRCLLKALCMSSPNMFSHHSCRKCSQNVRIADFVIYLSSVRCLDWTRVLSPASISWWPTSADQVSSSGRTYEWNHLVSCFPCC